MRSLLTTTSARRSMKMVMMFGLFMRLMSTNVCFLLEKQENSIVVRKRFLEENERLDGMVDGGGDCRWKREKKRWRDNDALVIRFDNLTLR